MHHDELTSDSGFVDDTSVSRSDTFTDIEPLYSNPKTHSQLFTATLRGKRFILKALKAEYAIHPNYRELLNKEFEIGYRMSHQNIAATHGIYHIEGLGEVIAIEYVDGITLAEAIAEGQIESDMAYIILGEVCDALHYMHSLQIIHRDLKPENIMLTHNGSHVKLIDFGLADSDAHTIFKQPAGTRRYASPELVEGRKIDNRSDIYSLGVIIELMLHGRRARKVARRCMSARPEERYHDANDVKRALLRPSRKPLYVALAMGVVATAVMATIAYNVGMRTADVGQSAQSVVVANTEQAAALYDDIIKDVDSLMESRYLAHYSRVATIMTEDEARAFSSDKEALDRDIDSLANEIFNSKIDTTSEYHTMYMSLMQGHIERQRLSYTLRFNAATNEMYIRAFGL